MYGVKTTKQHLQKWPKTTLKTPGEDESTDSNSNCEQPQRKKSRQGSELAAAFKYDGCGNFATRGAGVASHLTASDVLV